MLGLGSLLEQNDWRAREQQAAISALYTAPVQTLRARVDAAIAEASARLDAAREAKEILDRNPDVDRLIDLLGKKVF